MKVGSSVELVASEKRTCAKHGGYEARQEKWWGVLRPWTPCEGCVADEIQKETQAEETRKFEKRMEKAGIPLRYRDKEFGGYRTSGPGQQAALLVARAYAAEFPVHRTDGRCLVFVGTAGTGKTHLALAICKDILRGGFTALYTTVHEAIEAIRSTWRNDSPETEAAALRRMTDVDLLVLDEVGVQYGKESEQVELFKILNKRYNDVKPTLAISNVSQDELKFYLGARVYDRMRENGGKVVGFDWESERGKK